MIAQEKLQKKLNKRKRKNRKKIIIPAFGLGNSIDILSSHPPRTDVIPMKGITHSYDFDFTDESQSNSQWYPNQSIPMNDNNNIHKNIMKFYNGKMVYNINQQNILQNISQK